jgi:superfamily II DNA or RNA helicase
MLKRHISSKQQIIHSSNKNFVIGFFYIRENIYWNNPLENYYKTGITQDIKNRECPYITTEKIKGKFIKVIQLHSQYNINSKQKLHNIDNLIKLRFKSLNIRDTGGTEFYNKNIINLIEGFLISIGVSFKVLSDDEVEDLERFIYLKNVLTHNIIFQRYLKNKKLYKNNTDLSDLLPLDYQQEILDKIYQFYQDNKIGKLLWACGLGKTLMSLFIIRHLNCKNILIGVSSISLQQDFKREILRLFPNKDNILCIGGDDEGFKNTFDIYKLNQFYNKLTNEPKFIIVTYHSCYKLVDYTFDFKLGDECHHLVGFDDENKETGFKKFHRIQSDKTLYMTATEKTIEKTIENMSNNIYSMDNVQQFGNIIDKKTFKWAIENKKITDFNVLLIENNDYDMDEIIKSLNIDIDVKDRELFINCYITVRSFDKYNKLSHILLYTNTTSNADKCQRFIEQILIKLNRYDIYNKALHSKNDFNNTEEIEKFKNSKYGIISCVYLFGEGFNLKELNGTCTADTMDSTIRISQYLTRANRLNKNDQNKIAYNIIPYNIKSTDKIKHILTELGNADIEYKYDIDTIKNYIEILPEDDSKIDENKNDESIIMSEEIERIRLMLKHRRILKLNLSVEQNEYKYMKQLNKCMKIKSMKEYKDSKDKHEMYIEEPEKYFTEKGVWSNVCDFLNIDTSKYISLKEDWIKYCKMLKINTLEEYDIRCKTDEILPREPVYFYVGFTNMGQELCFKNRRK